MSWGQFVGNDDFTNCLLVYMVSYSITPSFRDSLLIHVTTVSAH